jgi:integrase
MASLEKRYDGRYRIVFCWQGERRYHSLGKLPERDARSCLDRLEESLRFVDRGLLEVPADVELGRFLVSGGKLNGKPAFKAPFTLAELLKRYQTEHPDGVKEASTRSTESIHIAHLLRIIDPKTIVRAIATETLQGYVNVRAKENGLGGRPISHVTIQKEIGTLSSVWNRWARPLGLVESPAPTQGLIYAKVRTKPPFLTWDQIRRQVARGGLSPLEIKDLWASLFLTLGQVQELLAHVKARGGRPWVYVAFCLAAYTGARRSEILRSRIDDLDFEAGTITIREKKRDRTREMTFRTVPMAARLRQVLRAWLQDDHPGGAYTICGRGGQPLTRQTMTKAFRAGLEGSLWQPVQGYHVLRHSFASNCALKAVDQRIIDAWMGHQTEAMRRRYSHLFPEQQQAAIRSVFG